MRPSFFIFSLPRSGSSWLSLFLTGQDSYCYHEPTADYVPAQWVDVAENRPENVVGAVDTGAYLYSPLICDAMPRDTQYAVLVRDPYEVEKSCKQLGFTGFDIHKEYERICRMPFTKIYYSDFNDLDYLESIWTRFIGTEFDSERALMFQEMNIQRDVKMFTENRADLVDHMRRLLS